MPSHEKPDGRATLPVAPGSPCSGLADFARRVVLALLILALAYLLWRGAHVLLLAFAGLLLAVFLSALSEWLSLRTGLPYRGALAIVVVGLVLLMGGLGWLLANRLAAQIAQLAEKLPQSLAEVRDYLEAYPWGRLLQEKAPRAAEALANAGDFPQVTGLVSGVAGFLEAAVVIAFVGIFGAAEPEVYRAGLLHLVPRGQRRRVSEALQAVAFNLRWWLVGQILLMVLMGITTATGLWLIGVPMALALGVIAGILELIPYIGAWLAAVPAALIALMLGPWHLAMTLALYLALHLLEGYVLAPLIQRHAVHLPPALLLVAQVLLGTLLGVLGLFVAAPLTVTAIVFVKMLYIEDSLGDESVEVPGEPGPAALPTASAAREGAARVGRPR
jgi:predicted PurR-regulated permease PerM